MCIASCKRDAKRLRTGRSAGVGMHCAASVMCSETARHAEVASRWISCIVFTCCAVPVRRDMLHMVDIAQLVEHLIVVQKVARSSRVIHPIKPRSPGLFCLFRHGRRACRLSVASVVLIFVCADGSPYVTGGRVGISRESDASRAVMRSARDERAIGPVDCGCLRLIRGCGRGRSAAAPRKRRNH